MVLGWWWEMTAWKNVILSFKVKHERVALLITDKNVQYSSRILGVSESWCRERCRSLSHFAKTNNSLYPVSPSPGFHNNNTPLRSLLSSPPTQRHPAPNSPAGGLAWSQHKLVNTRNCAEHWKYTKKGNVCACFYVYVPVSQFLMSPSLGVQLLVTHPVKNKLGICVCVNAWMHDTQRGRETKP